AKCGLDGVVASPLEIEAIGAAIEKKDFLIVTPGIRSDAETRKEKRNKLETIDDQKRVMTAQQAVAAGADYLVIGRPILQAEDRISAVQKIIEEIETV
ncbi:MAG: orotidine 5'-phosphate decarboxylase, partial [Acidobacteriota bacterium]|nr:orotidine 5'-phosphate decarboxylase [Acidobacteriota bacterium]